MPLFFWIPIASVIIFAFIFLYISKIIATPPVGRAQDYLENPINKDKRLIACIGDSLTHGNIGQSWVDFLRNEFPGDVFLNEGINGNTAWQVLQRLNPILNLKPDIVILMIGSNDAMGSFDKKSGIRYLRNNNLPEVPTFEKYKAQAIDMESAAIAQVAEQFGIPAVLVRCLSDRADAGSQKLSSKFLNKAAKRSYNTAQKILNILL